MLHRLFAPGSDRAAEKWKDDYAIEGVGGLGLHHLYRAMAWLGEVLPKDQQDGATPFAPRTNKDLIEEALFARRRDLFTDLDIVFFDTTSIYFEGEGGETIGQRGHSKDHRPDLKQMVVGMVLDQNGNPLCSELWPGNTADVKSLVPIVERLKSRFGIGSVCIVADRGMISAETLAEVEKREWKYILGVRMRSSTEAKAVVARAGRYAEVHPKSDDRNDPSPLKVKQVWVEDTRRYVVCVNEDQAKKDGHDREAVVASLRDALGKGDKSLVGNKGYRKYLRAGGKQFAVDEDKSQGGSALRRQVGADDEHGSPGARSGAEVQATVDGGGCLPLDEIAAGYQADIPQVRRNDSRARVLLVSGVTVAQGTGRPFDAQGVEAGMGRRHPGSRQPN